MQWFEYLIIIAAVTFVGSVIFLHFYLKRKGKSLSGDCGGNCKNCTGNCGSCSHQCGNRQLIEEYRNSLKNN